MESLVTIGQIFSAYMGLFILIAGIIGSILQIVVFSTTRTYRKTPCTFYLLLAAMHDLGQLIVGLGPHVVTSYLNININQVSLAWCKLRFFFGSSLAAISLSCVCLANIDQFFVTCRSVRFRQWSNMKVAHRTTLCIMIMWWLHGSLWLFFRDVPPTKNGLCVYTNRAFFLYATVFLFFHLCTVHSLIMVTFAFLCYRNIRRSIALTHRQYDRQMIMMVYMQTILACLSMIPYGVVVAYMFIMKYWQENRMTTDNELLALAVTFTLLFITFGVRCVMLIIFMLD